MKGYRKNSVGGRWKFNRYFSLKASAQRNTSGQRRVRRREDQWKRDNPPRY